MSTIKLIKILKTLNKHLCALIGFVFFIELLVDDLRKVLN